ncbi:hypothetical protein NCS56_01539900 [Fusarium sp. Ph1]|nr:hypothetical protein NCS56_01539900 [Fusarium sp. Ph1]
MSVNGSIISSPKPEPPSDISQHPSGALSFPTVTVTSDDDSDDDSNAVPNSAGPAPPANLNIYHALAGVKAFADLAPNDEPFRFIFVSGRSSTQNPGPFTNRYTRVKGETELWLSEMRSPYPRLITEAVGPGVVSERDHAAIKPYVPDQGFFHNSARAVLGPPVRMAFPSLDAPTEPLGKFFLVEMAIGRFDEQLDEGGSDITILKGGMRVLKDPAFLRLAGLS